MVVSHVIFNNIIPSTKVKSIDIEKILLNSHEFSVEQNKIRDGDQNDYRPSLIIEPMTIRLTAVCSKKHYYIRKKRRADCTALNLLDYHSDFSLQISCENWRSSWRSGVVFQGAKPPKTRITTGFF